jgi:hypothetical protein
MLTFTHVMNLFAYELAGLRGWRFSGATVGSRAPQRFLFRHDAILRSARTQRECQSSSGSPFDGL